MDKILEFLKKWGTAIIIVLLLLLNFKDCTNNVKFKKLDKKISAIDSTTKAIPVYKILSEKEVRDVMQEVMLDFLLAEDALDKKLITASEIKERIDND